MRFRIKPTASGCANIGCGTLLLGGIIFVVGLRFWNARTADAVVREYERQGFRLKSYSSYDGTMTIEPVVPADFDDAALSRLVTFYRKRNRRDGALTLEFDHCRRLTNLSALDEVASNLTQLSLNDCGIITNLDGLRKQQLLWSLRLNGCKKLTNVDALPSAHHLRSIELEDCTALVNIDGLAKQTELGDLKLAGCTALSKFDALGSLQLRRLDLTGCDHLQNVDLLKGCVKLEELNLSHCADLSSIASLAGLPELRRLNLGGCPRLKDLSPLARLNLRWLGLADSPQLTDLNALAKLPAVNPDAFIFGLTSLDAQRCPQLHDVKGLFNGQSLLQADFTGSPVARADLVRLRQAFPTAHINFREAK
jgi:hypothetical protein